MGPNLVTGIKSPMTKKFQTLKGGGGGVRPPCPPRSATEMDFFFNALSLMNILNPGQNPTGQNPTQNKPHQENPTQTQPHSLILISGKKPTFKIILKI